MKLGRFITFEGIEGSGKSTQIARLAERLTGAGLSVVRVREPGGTAIGDRIRQVLLDPACEDMCAETEMYLFAASRAQLVRQTILPAIERGEVVLCDRFVHSSLAYQGAGRGLGRPLVAQVNAAAIDGLRPDRIVVLDIAPEEALGRAAARAALDRIEQERIEFFENTREAFLDEAERDPATFAVVPAEAGPDAVEDAVWQRVAHLFDAPPGSAS
jgi:dTMP kinase